MPMSSLNVAEWSPEQVADWLSGLGPTVARYVPALRERGLDGAKLLALRCDDLEYLGMHIIGHQELLLEAVEHLRNFQYEVSRECVQQLALRVSVVATTLARALRHHSDKRLETQTLADVARTVHAVKPLVCWLDRWPLCSSGGAAATLAERRAALLKLSLEAATSAMRDRFAEQPANAVAAAAEATASTADYIIQDVSDPMILQPASLDTVTLRQGGKPLGFDVVPSFCGHHQLADIRFGSPAHASGAVHIGDEIVQVGGQCVIGWSGAAVVRLCAAAGAELALRVRRRAARAPPVLATPQLHRMHRLQRCRPPHYVIDDFRCELSPLPAPPAVTQSIAESAEERARDESPPASSDESEPLSPPASPTQLHLDHTRYVYVYVYVYVPTLLVHTSIAESAEERARDESPPASSDESEPLSPPASPTQLHLDHTRMYPPKPRASVQRRHTISGDSPLYKRPSHTIEQFWQELKQQRWGHEGGSASMTPTPDDIALYARDKAVSCSTGLELSPRPRTCLGVVLDRPRRPSRTDEDPVPPTSDRARGKLDKAHSTPAYDFDTSIDEPGPLAAQTIPESPTTPTDAPDKSLELKKSNSQRDRERVLETINMAMLEHRRRSTVSPQQTPEPSDMPAPRFPRSSSSRAPEPPPRPAVSARPSHMSGAGGGTFPVLRAVPRVESPPAPASPLKPVRPIDVTHISVPLRHITKHDIRVIPSERRELPAINSEQEASTPTSSLRRRSPPAPPAAPPAPDIVLGAHVQNDSAPTRGLALSPTSAVRGIFPTSKSRSLKKKSSILAKRRQVPARALAARGALGAVWQRVRARGAQLPRWARRHLLLTHNLLYAYRTPDCAKADCMIYLEGCTVSAAGEVKSRAHAFKVYHTGTAFYFACDSRDAMLAWIQLIHRATLLPSLAANMDVSKQFSETDYSETESDTESPSKERERSRERDKDKSKFGSLKKLTVRMQRSESHENVPHSSTSLDRKYLRFFSRNKTKDEDKPSKSSKSKQPAAAPEPYPGGRRGAAPSPPAAPRRLPPPLHYIHASNPNLLDFDKSDFVTKPMLHVPKPKPKPENLMGFVTLEQFMLKKQAEERRQNRDVQSARPHPTHDSTRLENIVPDVIYGEVGPNDGGSSTSSRRTEDTGGGKPISVRGKDGYEKIVYRDEVSSSRPSATHDSRWRDSLRRNDKVHTTSANTGESGTLHTPQSHAPQLQLSLDSWSGSSTSSPAGRGARAPWGGRQYPHLQCPPTFQPETYSLARLPPRRPDPDT
ncbi:LOW QUALITY PROTEIN: connector enhancer of ksr [Anticarsia gemmatalis]|uniref:LOW QUALITY PROTEIN: connector enhancer of ksr n=1 Tax=Anticarsia gemmatalis TaxID=129554 RepID=UPI003F76C3D6